MCPWYPSWQIFEQDMKVAAGFVPAFKLEPKKQSAIMRATRSLSVFENIQATKPLHETELAREWMSKIGMAPLPQ